MLKSLFARFISLFRLKRAKPKTEEQVVPPEILAQAPKSIIDEKGYSAHNSYPVCIKTSIHTPSVFIEIEREDKGALEDYFFDSLIGQFKDKIKNNIKIQLPHFNVTPDLAYIDYESNQFWVIEIDEPYTTDNKGSFIPIHCKGMDDERNKVLLANGWSVIRFAEVQVATLAGDCVRFISSIINSKTSTNFELPQTPIWTFAEALVMIENKTRNNYLPFEFQEVVRRGSVCSFRKFRVEKIEETISKKGEKFIMVSLYLYKNHSKNGTESFGEHECWIRESVFWENFSKSEVGKIIYRDCHITKAERSLNLGGLFIGPAFFEAVGSSHGKFFNLYEESSFKIIHWSNIVELAQKYGTAKTYKQITQELINNHSNTRV